MAEPINLVDMDRDDISAVQPQTQRDDKSYGQKLFERSTKDLKLGFQNPHFRDFQRLQRMNKSHLEDKLAAIQAVCIQQSEISEDNLKFLGPALHTYGKLNTFANIRVSFLLIHSTQLKLLETCSS
jgi:hypothetical protein